MGAKVAQLCGCEKRDVSRNLSLRWLNDESPVGTAGYAGLPHRRARAVNLQHPWDSGYVGAPAAPTFFWIAAAVGLGLAWGAGGHAVKVVGAL